VRLLILGVWIVLMGSGLLLLHGRSVREASASAGWPTTGGVVVRSQVARHEHGGRSPYVDHEAEVRYRYTVGGRAYESGRIAIGVFDEFRDVTEAQRRASGFPVGGPVRVHYDPRAPERSTLEPGVRAPGAGMWTALWGGLVLAGLGLAAAGWRSVRRRGGIARVVDRDLFGGR
jgi:hypothetical protein